MPSTEQTVAVRRVTVNLCALCISGRGGECHVPGCILCMNRAPDMPLMPELMEPVKPIDDHELVLLTASQLAALAAWRALPDARRQYVLDCLATEAQQHERAAGIYEGREASPLAQRGARTATERAADLACAREVLK